MTSVAPLVGRIIGQCGGRKYCLSAHRTAAAPKAIGHDRSGLTLDDLAGKQPELMGGRGLTANPGQNPAMPLAHASPRCGARTRACAPCQGPS